MLVQVIRNNNTGRFDSRCDERHLFLPCPLSLKPSSLSFVFLVIPRICARKMSFNCRRQCNITTLLSLAVVAQWPALLSFGQTGPANPAPFNPSAWPLAVKNPYVNTWLSGGQILSDNWANVQGVNHDVSPAFFCLFYVGVILVR